MIFQILHPILWMIIKLRTKPRIHILNEQPKFNGNVIYAVNHSCVHDIPIAIQVIKKHFYLLMGKQDLEVIDRIFFNLNGTVWVDRKNRDNRRKAVSKMKNLLRGGKIF